MSERVRAADLAAGARGCEGVAATIAVGPAHEAPVGPAQKASVGGTQFHAGRRRQR